MVPRLPFPEPSLPSGAHMPTPAKERTVNRLLIVADDQSVYVEAAVWFEDLGLPVDRTRSFDTASILLAHLPYSAVVVHCGDETADSQIQLWKLQGLLQCAQGTPVVLLTSTSLPKGAENSIMKDVSLYFDRKVPLSEIAEAVRCLLHHASVRNERRETGRDALVQ